MDNRKAVSKKEFVRQLAKNMNVTQPQASAMYDGFIQTLNHLLPQGKPVILGEVCRLQHTVRPERERMDPNTKETVICPPTARIRCTTSSVYAKKHG